MSKSSYAAEGESPKAGQEKKAVWLIAAGIIALAGAAFAVAFARRRKEGKEEAR